MTILCTVAWQQFIVDSLYHCTDASGLDYLRPGHWVHDPVEVEMIVGRRSMGEADTIKAGWSVKGLWGLWCLFVAASIFTSVLASRTAWMPAEDRVGDE